MIQQIIRFLLDLKFQSYSTAQVDKAVKNIQ